MRDICQACERPADMCYCHVLPTLAHQWPVHVFQDRREAAHPLGTARPAVRALQQATLQTVDPNSVDSGSHVERWLDAHRENAVLIYPGPTAAPIAELTGNSPPLTLAFLDATWRRSRRILHTWPELADLPRYQVNAVTPSRYRIRKPPTDTALSTLEAIAAALETLEPVDGDRVSTALISLMDFIIDRQIQRIPSDVYARHYGDAQSGASGRSESRQPHSGSRED